MCKKRLNRSWSHLGLLTCVWAPRSTQERAAAKVTSRRCGLLPNYFGHLSFTRDPLGCVSEGGRGWTDCCLVSVVAVESQCWRRCSSAAVLYANRLRGLVRRDVWSALRAPVRSGQRASDYQQRHDQTRLPAGLVVRTHQDVLSRQGTMSVMSSTQTQHTVLIPLPLMLTVGVNDGSLHAASQPKLVGLVWGSVAATWRWVCIFSSVRKALVKFKCRISLVFAQWTWLFGTNLSKFWVCRRASNKWNNGEWRLWTKRIGLGDERFAAYRAWYNVGTSVRTWTRIVPQHRTH